MEKLKAVLKLFTIWVLVLVIGLAVVIASTYLYDHTWINAGLDAENVSHVYGDSWAITRDHRIFYYEKSRQAWPLYLELGQWTELEGANRTEMYGTAPRYLFAITATEFVFPRGSISRPNLTNQLLAAGAPEGCGDGIFSDYYYAISEDQIALYDFSTKSWIKADLPRKIEPPISTGNCQLYYIEDGRLMIIHFPLVEKSLEDYSISFTSEPTVIEQPLPENEDVVSMAASGYFLWVLTSSGEVYELQDGSETKKVLHSPCNQCSLLAGSIGFLFGGDGDMVDVWLVSEEIVYVYDRQMNAWKQMRTPRGSPIESISSLLTASETVGFSKTRLAVVNGIVYRQRPINSLTDFWLIFCAFPILFLVSFVVARLVKARFSKDKSLSPSKIT